MRPGQFRLGYPVGTQTIGDRVHVVKIAWKTNSFCLDGIQSKSRG